MYLNDSEINFFNQLFMIINGGHLFYHLNSLVCRSYMIIVYGGEEYVYIAKSLTIF